MIARMDDSIFEAYWNYQRSKVPTMVVDQEDKFVGIIGHTEWIRALYSTPHKFTHVNQIVNTKCTSIGEENPYSEARNIFSDRNINFLPVVNKDKDLIDFFIPERAFYKDYYWEGKLPRMYYANIIWAAAMEAKALGYSRISVVEFGVAGGNGLLNMQFHAREIGRLFGVEIEVYGFDSGEGVLMLDREHEDAWKEMHSNFAVGDFCTDYSVLSERLDTAKLIIGDIKDTGKIFYEKYNPAPLAAISIDVDVYSGTKYILDMLDTSSENVLPYIYMYWDDIYRGYENVGEGRALREFNEYHKDVIEIACDGNAERTFGQTSFGTIQSFKWEPSYRVCHYYKHPQYMVRPNVETPLLPLGLERYLP